MWFKPFYIGIVAGVLTSISMVPQLLKIVREKKAGDISVTMLLVLIAGLAMWVVYGIRIHDWPLMITNGFSCLLNATVLFFSLKYRKRDH